jgi:hypothetical protein
MAKKKKKKEREKNEWEIITISALFSVTVKGKQRPIYFFIYVLPINRCNDNFDWLYLSYVYSEFLET